MGRVRLDTPPAGAAPAEGGSAQRRLSLRHNFAWTLGGNVVYAATQWGMLVVLSRLLNPLALGEFALGLALTAPVMTFAYLKLRSVLATDVAREREFGDFLGLRLLGVAGAVLVIAGAVAWGGYPARTAGVILLVAAAKGLDAVGDIYQGVLQQRERMDRISMSLLVNGVVSLAAMWGLVYLTHSVLWGAVGSVLGSAAGLAFVVPAALGVIRGGEGTEGEPARPRFRAPVLRSLAVLALPLGVNTALGSLQANLPRYFIEHSLGTRQLGIFAAVAYLTVAGPLVINALGQSATPRLAQLYGHGQLAGFRRLLAKLVGLGVGVGLAGLLCAAVAGRWLLLRLYGAEYAGASEVLVWLMVAATVSYAYIFLGTAVSAMRLFRIQLPIGIGVFAALVASCALLVPRFGLRGAAWAMLASALVEGSLYCCIIFPRLRRAPVPGAAA